MPSQAVGPDLPGVSFTDEHDFLVGSPVAHHARKTRRAIPSAFPSPANAMRGIEVIVLFPVCIKLSSQTQIGKLAIARYRKRMFTLYTVKIAVEDARPAALAKKDERVRQWLEIWCDDGFQSLEWLGIVVPATLAHRRLRIVATNITIVWRKRCK